MDTVREVAASEGMRDAIESARIILRELGFIYGAQLRTARQQLAFDLLVAMGEASFHDGCYLGRPTARRPAAVPAC